MSANFILYVTSCEFDERAAKPKFVAQSRPALYYSQQQLQQLKLITQGEKLETSAKFCID